MYLKISNYTHQLDECKLRIRKRFARNQAQLLVGMTENWNIEAMLLGTSVSDLTTKIQALEAAYLVFNPNVTLLDNDGVTETAHKIVAANTLGGVRVNSIEYPDGEGAEYATKRKVVIELEAEYQLNATGLASQNLISFTEAISMQGTGGPRFVVHETRNSDPIPQIVSQRTPVSATQQGSATGYFDYPTIPPPLFPDWEQEPERKISFMSPRTLGSGSTLSSDRFGASWSYSFLAPSWFGNTPPNIGFQ